MIVMLKGDIRDNPAIGHTQRTATLIQSVEYFTYRILIRNGWGGGGGEGGKRF